jgi:hypothetical protein
MFEKGRWRVGQRLVCYVSVERIAKVEPIENGMITLVTVTVSKIPTHAELRVCLQRMA